MLHGRTALVTGSTSGIGLGIARALAGAGANVVVNGFADEGLAAAIEGELRAFGVDTAYDPADLRMPDEIERMVHDAQARFGSLDVVVNNAGIQHVADVEEFPVEKWNDVLAVNLSSSFHTIRTALPEMKRRDWGRIVNIASAHGLVASGQKAAYVTAKHGVIGLTKVVGLETATTRVTCNAICPGWVLTPLVQQQIDRRAADEGISEQEAKQRLLGDKQPSQQFVTPEQIGELTLFLCSVAAAEVRGAAWAIDGGWTAQ
jgi:3-hydroxybutyrate dehydrogenase